MGKAESTIAIILGCSLIGGVFDMIIYYLYSHSIIVNALITTDITLYGVLFMVLLIWELVGVIYAASK